MLQGKLFSVRKIKANHTPSRLYWHHQCVPHNLISKNSGMQRFIYRISRVFLINVEKHVGPFYFN
jgi:hypothetical protein